MRQQRFDSSGICLRRVFFGLFILVLCINWASSQIVYAQEQLKLETHAQFYAMCSGYLYGMYVAAGRPDDKESLLEASTLLTNTAFVLARDSGETEEELRTLTQHGMREGAEVPTTEAGGAAMERTMQTCVSAAKSIRDQLGR